MQIAPTAEQIAAWLEETSECRLDDADDRMRVADFIAEKLFLAAPAEQRQGVIHRIEIGQTVHMLEENPEGYAEGTVLDLAFQGSEPYALITWDDGAADPSWHRVRQLKAAPPPVYRDEILRAYSPFPTLRQAAE